MISAKPWSIEAVARLFLGVIVTLCVGMWLAGLLGSVKSKIAPDQLEFLQTLVMVVFFQGAAIGWIAVFLRQSNLSCREAFGLRPPSRLGVVAAGLAVGLLALPSMWLLQFAAESAMEMLRLNPVAQTAVQELQNSNLTNGETMVFAFLTIVLAPVVEETLFRGILYPTIKQAGHPRWALWGSSVLFGALHFNLMTFVPLVLLAALLVILYEATDSLLAPIAAHSIFNAANFLYVLFQDPVNRLLHIS